MTMASNVFEKSELQNDDQASVLYSPFRSKSLNPSSWTSKMSFWKHYLKETATERKTLMFDMDKLPLLFERKGIIPKCLPTVLEELQRSGDVKSLQDYKKSNSWLSWGFNVLVKQPLAWGFDQIIGSPKKQPSTFVWTHVLKKVSEEVLDLHHAKSHLGITSNLISYSSFQDVCSSLITSDDDFQLILTYLESEKKIQLVNTQKNGLMIKICEKGETITPAQEVDIQTFEILEGRRRLEKEVEILNSKIDELTKEAQSFMKASKKSRALHCLRKRKFVIKAVERRYTMLSNLEEILQKIDDAQSNEMVVSACESGVAAMKNLNKELTVDRVEGVMESVQEALQDSDEVRQALSIDVMSESGFETFEAEEELEAMLKEMSGEDLHMLPQAEDNTLPDIASLSLKTLDLPDVPTHSPSSSPSIQPYRNKKSEGTEISS